MIAGARVDVAPYKRDPMDFVLWKPSKPGEPAWPSPSGIATHGRPGWHIECSAMSWKHLGETFDIHGGGIDLVFPHHENEIAQSRCSFHSPMMANFWMHNGFLQVEGEKMAKSLGNFITIRELLSDWRGKRWYGPEIRLLMLSTQYRQPIDWTLQGLEESRRVISQWEVITANVDHDRIEIRPTMHVAQALFDDLNTPEAIFHLHELAKAARTGEAASAELYSNLVFLGVFADRRAEARQIKQELPWVPKADGASEQVAQWWVPNSGDASEQVVQMYNERNRRFLAAISNMSSSSNVATTISSIEPKLSELLSPWKKYGPPFISPEDVKFISDTLRIEELNRRIEQRQNARAAKNFGESDRIRNELAALRILLKDSKDGTTWEIAR
jgi:cysteinyl-tRNA synthetase